MLSIRWWFSHNDIVINNLVNIKKSSTWILCSDWIKLPFHACTHSKDSFTFQILHKHFSLLVKLVVIGTTSLTTPPQKKSPIKTNKTKETTHSIYGFIEIWPLTVLTDILTQQQLLVIV